MSEERNILDHIKPRKVEVPDQAYFESLANEIIEKEKGSAKVIPMWKKPVVWVATAAAVGALVIFSTYFTDTNNEKEVLIAFNELSSEDILDYIDENIEEFETELIASYVDETELSAGQYIEIETDNSVSESAEETNASNENIIPESINKDAILDYLEDQEINLDELYDDESFI